MTGGGQLCPGQNRQCSFPNDVQMNVVSPNGVITEPAVSHQTRKLHARLLDVQAPEIASFRTNFQSPLSPPPPPRSGPRRGKYISQEGVSLIRLFVKFPVASDTMQGTNLLPLGVTFLKGYARVFLVYNGQQPLFKMERNCITSSHFPTLTTESRRALGLPFDCRLISYGTPRFFWTRTLFHVCMPRSWSLMCPPLVGWDHLARRGSGRVG
jgi:hypothetical protein